MSRADLDAQWALFKEMAKARGLDMLEDLDPWKRPRFAHPHIESMWYGWQAALAAQAPAQGEVVAKCPTCGDSGKVEAAFSSSQYGLINCKECAR